MSRSRRRLRPRGERGRPRRRHRGEHHGQVPVAQALPGRAGARQQRADGPVDAGRGGRARSVHERLRRSARAQRGVRRRAGAVARRRVGPLRRRRWRAGDRRPVRRDQGPHRGMDGDRRRQLRAGHRARRRAVRSTGSRRRTDPRMAGGPTFPDHATQRHAVTVDDVALRELVPSVLSVLVRRGADFATGEDAVQEALIRALSAWNDEPPSDPKGWLITVAWRAFLDMTRSDASRRDREVRFETAPPAGAVPGADDTLHLYFLCAHPDLTSSSAVALTLRAVGGLTTRQIAQAYLVPESTMAQRISRAKRTVARAGVDRPGDVGTVMRVLYLVFNEGYSGDVDLAAEAIRLTRQLAALVDDPEVDGLLALMLLHHARRRSRTRPDGSIVPLAEQDRRLWDTGLISEGIELTHAALARDRLGEYQAQAAIAALHADAPRVEETDWVQIVEWYDELLRFADTPVVRLNRAVAVGEADGAPAGLAALADVDDHVPRREAVAAYLHEKNGDLELAARLYADAARNAPNLAEREHQTRQAARLNEVLRCTRRSGRADAERR